jgi:hypothetical protein
MRVEWHGQSAFTQAAPEATVFTERGPNTIFVFELGGIKILNQTCAAPLWSPCRV